MEDLFACFAAQSATHFFVPAGKQELEKQQIDDWLSDWLVEGEAVTGHQGSSAVTIGRWHWSGDTWQAASAARED